MVSRDGREGKDVRKNEKGGGSKAARCEKGGYCVQGGDKGRKAQQGGRVKSDNRGERGIKKKDENMNERSHVRV